MLASVANVQVHPDKTGEAQRIFRDSVIPAVKQQKGFKGALLLADPTTGKGLSIMLWETTADLAAGESSSDYQRHIDEFASMLTGPSSREAYEVSVHL